MKALRIDVDVTPIREDGACGGAKPFVLDLLQGLASAPNPHHYRLLTASHNHGTFAAYERLGMRRHLVDGLTPPIGLRAAGTDLLFCPMTAPTFAEAGVTTVCVLYDLQHLAYPWFFDERELTHRQQFYSQLIAHGDHVVCISEFSRISLILRLGVPPERTSVVPIAIHHRLQTCTDEAAWDLLASAALPRCRFAFYPANFWPHKNHRILLVAFSRFLKEHRDSDLHLVLTGELLGEGETIRSAIDRMGLSSRVHVLGFVPEPQLAALWSAASLLVFPSLLEGFGIPVTEAMYFGKPVVCSRAGSLPEVAGDEAVYFDPRNPQTIVDALAFAIEPSADMRQRTARARERLEAYRPAAVVEQYLEVFERVTSRPSPKLASAMLERPDGHLLSPLEAYARYLEVSRDPRAIESLRRALSESESAAAVRIRALHGRLAEAEADRAARLEVIQRQGAELGRMPALQADIEFLTREWKASEADRAARLEIIDRQGAQIERQGAQIERLSAEVWRRSGWRRLWPWA